MGWGCMAGHCARVCLAVMVVTKEGLLFEKGVSAATERWWWPVEARLESPRLPPAVVLMVGAWLGAASAAGVVGARMATGAVPVAVL